MGDSEGAGNARVAHAPTRKTALELAQWLEEHPKVERVYYPARVASQHELAKNQQKTGGGIVSFDVKGGREAAWKVVDGLS